jgi:hypothetical protein
MNGQLSLGNIEKEYVIKEVVLGRTQEPNIKE